MSHQANTVKANGIKIYYETFGSGKEVIFLHGSMATGSVWKPYIPILNEALRAEGIPR